VSDSDAWEAAPCGQCEHERELNGPTAERMTFGPVRWRVTVADPDFEQFACDQHLRGLCDFVAVYGHDAIVKRIRAPFETEETMRRAREVIGEAARAWEPRRERYGLDNP
jgi:hypothetical protein